jgi:hypothetical protein
MKNKSVLVIAFAVVIILALASGVSAQSSTPVQMQEDIQPDNTQPEGVLSVATLVSEAISYQGVLEESGTPVTGSRDMTFSLYSDDSCTTFVTGIVDISDVPVDNGLFSVQLDFDQSVFTGQVLFLEVEVAGTAIACQEILSVPYALSLRPGAKIATDSTANYAAPLIGEVSSTSPGGYSAGLRGINNGTAGNGIGVYGSQAGNGWGVYGQVDGNGWGVYGQVDGNGRGVYGKADGAAGIGVYGKADSATGIGVYAQGGSPSGTALMLSNGGIRVSGAGLGTNAPVFIHQATPGNITCGFFQCTTIDHPLTNGDPNAILIVTQNFNPDTISGTVNNPHPVGVQYLSTPSRWVIYNVDLLAMTDGAVFNVMVVKP